MNWLERLLRRRETERLLDSELRHHLDSLIAAKTRDGMSESEARRQARLEFGALDEVKEECRDARGTVLVESVLKDILLAVRTLGASPVFSIVAVATLALGIGANTAIFQLLDSVFLRSLPVRSPDQLVSVHIRSGNGGFGISHDEQRLTYPLFEDIRAHQQGLAGVFAWTDQGVRIGAPPDTRPANALIASGEFFSVLGVEPVAGRLLNAADDYVGCPSPAVVLSYAVWQSEFGGRPSAIGSRLAIEGLQLEIVGVTPPEFTGLEPGKNFDVAVPICTLVRGEDRHFLRSDLFWLNVMGRLKSGWTRERASQQLLSISPALFAATAPAGYSTQSIERYKRFVLEAIPGAKGVSRLRLKYQTSLWLLLGITALVLLIACANLANLMLARAGARQREFAVRVALGASRSRLLQHAISESILLALGGAAAGFVLARVLSGVIVSSLGTEQNPLRLDLKTDWRILVFTAAVSLAACMIFGLVPAVRSLCSNPADAIKTGARGLTADRTRFSFQRCLIVAQVSISVVLVAGALLLVRSFRNLITLDPGFRETGILLASFDMSHMHIPRDQIKASVQALIDEVRSVPQVEAAAATTNILIGGGSWTLGVKASAVQGAWSKFTWVSPGYFETVQTPLLAGRDFNASDSASSPKVVIVNETFARRYFPGANPIGQTFRSVQEPGYPEAEYEIVAICKDTRYFDLRDTPPPQSFAPISQHPSYGPYAGMYIRSSAPLAAISSAIKRSISQSRPEIGMDFRVFETQIREGLVRERMMASLSGFFGALAALLATIGLYGVIAYIVVSRRAEIGIRMALGASRLKVIGLLMSEALALAVFGVMIGLAGSLLFARAAKSLLFGITAYDPVTYCVACALLGAAVAFGSYFPARRASKLDPLTVLRCD
jgi:predicted permease